MDCVEVCRERFARWESMLGERGFTPIVVVGVGHGVRGGQTLVCTLEGIDDGRLMRLFLGLGGKLEEGRCS